MKLKWIYIASLIPIVAGCAERVTSESASVVTRADNAAYGLEGTWRGVITGRAFGTAGGVYDVNEVLTIQPDGTWSLRSSNGEARGRVVRTSRYGVTLDGRYTGGSLDGAPVHYVLVRRWPGGLVGSADDYYLLHEVPADAYFQKQD